MKEKPKFAKVAYKLDKDVIESIKTEVAEYNIDLDNIDVLRKSSSSEEKAQLEPGSRTAIKYVSTRSVDEIGDIVMPKGVILKQFIKGGSPVFFNHDYSLPAIGKEIKIKADDWGIKVTQKYANTGPSTLSEILWILTQEGMNTQSSVGLIPLETIRVGDENFDSAIKELSKEWPELKKTKKNVRRIIAKSLLFEISDVGLGMNLDTSVEAVSKTAKEAGADEVLLKQLNLPILKADEVVIDEEIVKKLDSFKQKINCIDNYEEAKKTLKEKTGEETFTMEEIVEEISKQVDTEESPEVVETEALKDEEKEKIVEENIDKSIQKVTLVKEPSVVKLISLPKPDYKNMIKETIKREIRRKKGRLI